MSTPVQHVHLASATAAVAQAKTHSATRAFGTTFAWAAGSKVVTEALRLGGMLWLTRLLTADMFGLVLVANRIVQGLNMASDLGIQASIVRHEAGVPRTFLDTAWTLQALRGLLLFSACVALAPAAADFYDQPTLSALVPVAGASLLLAGLQAPALALVQRRLQIRTWATIDVASQAASTAAMVVIALTTHSIWALVVGPLVGAGTRLVTSHLLPPREKPRFGWDRVAARSLLVFGVWITFNTFAGWLADSAEALVLPRIVDMGVVGVYGVALQLGSIPYRLLVAVGANAAFPLFSRVHNAGESLAPAYLSVQRLVLVVGGAAISGLLAVGAPTVDLVLDPRWHAAGAMLLPILVGQWFRVLAILGANSVLALGHVPWLITGNGAKVLGYLVSVPIGIAIGERHGAVALGALWGFACGESLSFFTYRWALAREGLKLGAAEAGPCLRFALSMALVVALRTLGDGMPSFARTVAPVVAVVAVWIGPLRKVAVHSWRQGRAVA